MNDIDKLRKQAKKELEFLTSSHKTSLLNTQQLIEELEIHRIELKMQNQELQKSQLEVEHMRDKYLELYDFAPIGYVTLNEEGIIEKSNLKGADLLGVYRTDLLGKHLQAFVAPTEQDRFFLCLRQISLQQQQIKAEFRMLKQNGSPVYIQLDGVGVFDADEQFSHMNITLIDITERKQVQTDLQKSTDELRKSLNEKEFLIQEIHHRVKNNLQMIISLLRIQTRNIDNDFAIEQLKDCEKRIQVMSDLHEILYLTNDFSDVCLLSFFKRLIKNLCFLYNRENMAVDLNISVKGLGFEQAIYCGLIVNELISNALKHAFPANWTGTPQLTLEFSLKDKKHYFLKLKDNGIGISPTPSPKTLGLSLVDMFIKKLKGKKTIKKRKGTSFEIVFAKVEPEMLSPPQSK